MTVRRVTLDRSRPLQEALDCGHTRWHPGIPPIARIAQDEVVVADVRDGGDVQIRPDTVEAELRYDLDRLHPLTGPFHVEGAEPGDLLEVEIIDVEPPDFGWSRLVPGGGGLMRDHVHDSLLVKWRLEEGVARSPELPGIAVRGAPFVGTIGVAPSPDRLSPTIAREAALREAGGWALMPAAKHAVPDSAAVRETGLRTLPPREFGGNMDIKDIAPGSRVSFVVNVAGGLLSIGDLHFAQGDGESFGTAIEIGGAVTFRCRIRRAGWRPTGPFVEAASRPDPPAERRWLITTGTSVDAEDRNRYLDLNLAATNALNEMTAYLVGERGLTEPQAQVLISVAADLRVNVVNNPPNPVVSVALPLDVFEEE
jgi:formamidase